MNFKIDDKVYLRDHNITSVPDYVGVNSPVLLKHISVMNGRTSYWVDCEQTGQWFVIEQMMIPEEVYMSPLYKALNEQV